MLLQCTYHKYCNHSHSSTVAFPILTIIVVSRANSTHYCGDVVALLVGQRTYNLSVMGFESRLGTIA